MVETTLSLVKPDGVKKNIIGEVIKRFEQNGLKVVGLKMLHMTKRQAEGFYVVHKDRPFFHDLTSFMSSGPIIAMALKGENAIKRVRELMGATDPRQAEKGTIRRDFGNGIEENVVHGSDSSESAKFEVPYFFDALGLNG